MATKVTYKGNFTIADSDYHEVVYTGRTKSGAAIKITLKNAINLENIELAFQEKNDMVPSVTWQSCYDNTDTMEVPDFENWELECSDTTATGADAIVVGAGVVSIDGEQAMLTRGGGTFTLEREYRQQNADGDKGPVKGRIVIDGSTAKLTLNMLTFLDKFDTIFPATEKS